MVFIPNLQRKKQICQRVKQIRVERFGEGHGAQKAMAKALGIPYTTYRGYEENRTNDDFLRSFARKFGVPLIWLMAFDEGVEKEVAVTGSQVLIDVEKGIIGEGKYKIFQMNDDAMEPTIRKGAWVGVLPVKYGENLDRKVVVIQGASSRDVVLVRRLVTRRNILVATADNPHLAHETIDVKKKNIIGEVVWQFSNI